MTTDDWAALWQSLATEDVQSGAEGEQQMVTRWRRVAQELDAATGKRPNYPDPLLDFLLSRLTPDMTVLDIGAGVGRWTVPIARKVLHVTAIEPAPGMREVLRERLETLHITNVAIVAASWKDIHPATHDIAVASHSTYTSPDLLEYVRKMESCARKSCYLALRVPAHDGAIGELSRRVRGQWHDSPNFIVGYNLLLAVGVYGNVVMEQSAVRHWTDATLEDAVLRVKRHLRLEDNAHDAMLRDYLLQRLKLVKGAYQWPDGMRSALIYWDKDAA